MDQIIKKVLKKIENAGYEAYLVGGYVRDLILGKKSFDVDVCTNALPKELNKIFPNCQNNKYGGINFKIKKFNFDITTYRKEKKYEFRKPVEIEYINNLLEDITRRDFRCNAVCINSKGYIIDLVEGINDIENKILRTIGNSNQRFIEDPLRMLRAIRFMTILDFKLSDDVYSAIKSNCKEIATLSVTRIKEEFDKILVSRNALKGLEVLKNTGILKSLNISYAGLVYVEDLLGMWAQLNLEFNSAFTKEEKNTIINIRKILELNKIDQTVLFNYGLYQSLVAGEILGVSRVIINKMYKQMPIHSRNDVSIDSKKIMEILNISPSEILSGVFNDIIQEILSKRLNNNYQDIKKYLIFNREKWIK